MKLRAFVLLCMVGLIGADDAKKKDKSDQDKLQGTWSLVSGEPAKMFEEIKTIELVFSGESIEIKVVPGQEKPGTFKLDPAKTPKTIDITTKEDDGKVLGIYELDGDTLKLCLIDKKDAERPKEFKGIKESKQIYLVLKRDKK